MQCPRCGHVNDGMAQVCSTCGLVLREDAARSHAPGFGNSVVDALPSAPSWGEGNTWAPSAPNWGEGNGWTPSAPNMPGTWSPPAGTGRSSKINLVPNAPMGTGQGSGAGGLVPFSGGFAPSPPSYGGGQAPEMVTSLVETLGPGTLLKSGRYRLIQRFHAASVALPQGNEPPLMIASDVELPNERVLVQELRFVGARLEEAEYLRRAAAQRITSLAQMQGAPKLRDQFSERGKHFLVFELPAGESLLDRLQRSRGALEETTAIGYALQALDVLEGFERQSPAFIHGNVSPANIFLRPSGQVVLLGCSAALLAYPDGNVPSGQAGGIPGYAAPEQARGQASPKSDLYALCSTLHHAVTGTAPTPRPTPMPVPARRLNPDVSLELEELLSQGLRPAATQRFQSAGELRRALQPLASGGHRTRVPDDLREPQPGALAPMRTADGRLVLPRQRASQNPLVLMGVLLLLILLVGGGVLYTVSPHASTTGQPTPTPNDMAALFQSKGIGLSGGDFVFDSQRPNNSLKQDATRKVAAGDVAGALADYQNAVAADRGDAEAAIYATDLQIAKDNSPYVTVAAAVAFGNDSDTALARSELQGIYLAQQYVNSLSLLPGNQRVRVLVLNSGQSANDATTAANLLLQQIQNGNAQHLVGIIGWPESQQTQIALSTLAPSGLAVVSPTASSDGLSGNRGNFFALVPSDSAQAGELADAMVNQMAAQHILVASDPQVATSAALAQSFTNRAQQYANAGVQVQSAKFTTGQGDFSAVVSAATSHGDHWIYLAGSDQDAISLSQAVKRYNDLAGTSLRVIVGTQADTPALYGLGTSAGAQTVRSDPTVLAPLDLATLADVHASTALNLGKAGQSTFADDYAAQFGPSGEPDGLTDPNAASILSYDAARVLLAASARAVHVSSTATNYPSPTDVRQRLLQFDAGHPYSGVGGAIAFTVTGGQPVKALSLLQFTPVTQPTQTGPVETASIDKVVGGQAAFCGAASCGG